MKTQYKALCTISHVQIVQMGSLAVCAESGIQKLDSGYEVKNPREKGQVFVFRTKAARDSFIAQNNKNQGQTVFEAC